MLFRHRLLTNQASWTKIRINLKNITSSWNEKYVFARIKQQFCNLEKLDNWEVGKGE